MRACTICGGHHWIWVTEHDAADRRLSRCDICGALVVEDPAGRTASVSMEAWAETSRAPNWSEGLLQRRQLLDKASSSTKDPVAYAEEVFASYRWPAVQADFAAMAAGGAEELRAQYPGKPVSWFQAVNAELRDLEERYGDAST